MSLEYSIFLSVGQMRISRNRFAAYHRTFYASLVRRKSGKKYIQSWQFIPRDAVKRASLYPLYLNIFSSTKPGNISELFQFDSTSLADKLAQRRGKPGVAYLAK